MQCALSSLAVCSMRAGSAHSTWMQCAQCLRAMCSDACVLCAQCMNALCAVFACCLQHAWGQCAQCAHAVCAVLVCCVEHAWGQCPQFVNAVGTVQACTVHHACVLVRWYVWYAKRHANRGKCSPVTHGHRRLSPGPSKLAAADPGLQPLGVGVFHWPYEPRVPNS